MLGVVSTLWLGFFVNWLSSLLALTANAFYVLGYTMLLKRRTAHNVVWGGAAGCFPALIGWTAVTGSLAWPPVVLFLIVFFWTPPHTWALAFRYREDYAAADVPMLPVVASASRVTAGDPRLLLPDGRDQPGALAGCRHRLVLPNGGRAARRVADRRVAPAEGVEPGPGRRMPPCG